MQFELMASMMCANYGNLEAEVRDRNKSLVDKAGLAVQPHYL